MPRKIVSINVDETLVHEGKRIAKKQGKSFSRMVEELLSGYVKGVWKKEEEEQRKVEQKLEAEDKGEKLSKEFMKKLLYDPNYCPEGWVETSY
jgi:metal-responsive CopG/Arc/MetJ family transcriptional regulator